MILTLSPLFMLDVFVKASLLLSLAALFLVFARRLSAASRHLVGLFGLVGALALPILALLVPTIHVPLLPALVSSASERSVSTVGEDAGWLSSRTAETPARASESARTTGETPVSPSLPIADQAGVVTDPPPLAAASPAVPANRPEIPWRVLLVAVWAVGAVSVLAQSAVGTLRVRQIVRNATPVQHPEWRALAGELSRAIGAKKNVRLFHSAQVDVAMTAGIRNPVVLLPEEAYFWTPERRRMVLLHEFAHIQRGDCLSLLLTSLTSAIYWFHPLVWIIAGRLRREGEQAADDLVLSAGARASEYANELLAIVRSLGDRGQNPLPVMALAENTRGAQLEGRLRAILDPRLHRSAPSLLVGRLAMVALLGFAATVAAVEPWSQPCPTKKSVPAVACADAVKVAQAMPVPVITRKMKNWEMKDSAAVLANGFAFAKNRRDRSGSDWFSEGRSRYHDENYDRSIEAYKKAIEMGYSEDISAYNIACDYALMGDSDQAFEWLKKSAEAGFDLTSHMDGDDDLDSLRADPRMKALKAQARADHRSGTRNKIPAAIAGYERFAARSPKDGSGFYEKGKDLLRVGAYDKAVEAFQGAVQRESHVSAALYNIACAYSLKGDKKAALESLQKSLEAGYDSPSHMDRDDDLDAIRDEPKYKDLLDMAEELTLPNDFGSWNFGKLRFPNLSQSSQRQAIRRYESFIKSHPMSGRAYFNLGFVELRLDHLKEARDAFQKALELGYRKPTTMYNLACSYARMDQKDPAFDWLFKSIEAGFGDGGTMKSDDDLDNLRHDPRYKKAREMVATRHDDSDDM